MDTMRRTILPYQPYLKKYARKLRNHSTQSEIRLWYYLKGKQRLGFDFHRQKPIDNYIVDFYCCDLLLAIELDGISHTYEDAVEKDRSRDERLSVLGIKVLRFEDEDVYKRIDWVLETIDTEITKLTGQPTPNPSMEGSR
jgi:very-short-patch-repair endonuclease